MTQNYAGYMPEKEDITASECTNQDANRKDFSLFTKSSIMCFKFKETCPLKSRINIDKFCGVVS